MLKTYEAWFGNFSLDPESDFYGDSYWQKVSRKIYEPDTMVFLENCLDESTDFFDIGAATGAMSIVASSLGARVFAYEAVPRVYEIAKCHFEKNPHLTHLINLRNCAISNINGVLELGKNADSRVLASISNEQPTTFSKDKVKITALAEEIEEFHGKNRKLVIKIDIEGAEWKLLSDSRLLEVLITHKALVLLAIHPGFYRPFRKLPFGLTYFSKKIWQVQNLIVAYKFFSQLLNYASIKRTSMDSVKSAKKCVLLMFGGYFEFIINFGESNECF